MLFPIIGANPMAHTYVRLFLALALSLLAHRAPSQEVSLQIPDKGAFRLYPRQRPYFDWRWSLCDWERTGEARPAGVYTMKTGQWLSCTAKGDEELLAVTNSNAASRVNELIASEVSDESLKTVENCKTLQRIVVDRCEKPSKERMTKWAGLSKLQALEFCSDGSITASHVELIATIPSLESVGFNACYNLQGSCIRVLSRLQKLRVIDLTQTQTTDADLKDLSSMPDLQSLSLRFCQKVSDAGVREIAALKKLQVLDLSNCPEITDIGAAKLGSLTQLEDLDISDCFKLTDGCLKSLSGLTRLLSLRIDRCKVSDMGLNALKDMKSLRALRMQLPGVTDAGIKMIASFKLPLECLLLQSCNLTDVAAKDLAKLKDLRSLSFGGRMTDLGMKELTVLQGLEVLDIQNCFQVGDAALAAIGKLVNLRSLSFGPGDKITDAGMKSMSALVKLESLHLNCLKITDIGLKPLAGIKTLRALRITGCDEITWNGIEELKAALPALKVN